MIINNLYYYKANVIRVIDGDTIKMNIDLGFKIFWEVNARLYGINTPELTSSDAVTRQKAIDAKSFIESVIKPGDSILVKSKTLDKYGRPLCEVYYSKNEIFLNNELIEKGHAVIYLP